MLLRGKRIIVHPTLGKPGATAFQRLPSLMYWTLELAAYLEDAPWPATKDELIDYCDRTGAPLEVRQNLTEMDDDGEPYESIEEIWPDYPINNDDFYYEDE